MLVPAWSPSGRCASASARSPIARMTHSSTDPDIATLPRTLLAGHFSQPAARSRHYGNRWGLWQHKPPAERDHLPRSGSSVRARPWTSGDLDASGFRNVGAPARKLRRVVLVAIINAGQVLRRRSTSRHERVTTVSPLHDLALESGLATAPGH